MKKIYLIYFCLFSTLSYSQIPNGGFEEWEMEENYEKPRLWNTNQDTFYNRISKDTLRVEGNYSMKIHSDIPTAWQDCTSKASINYSLSQPVGTNKSFFFNLRLLPEIETDPPFFSFFCIPYVNGMAQPSIIWQTEEVYSDFTLIEIPIGNPEIDSVYVELASGALNGADDGCLFYSEAWVDGLGITLSTTANQQVLQSSIEVYPNPSNGEFIVKQDNHEYFNYTIFNQLGQKIKTGNLSSSLIKINQPGMYYLQLRSSYSMDRNVTKKLIVIK